LEHLWQEEVVRKEEKVIIKEKVGEKLTIGRMRLVHTLIINQQASS
jgi:hypothetical protein